MEPKLLKVEPLPDFSLKLYYETGEVKQFDVKPYANGSWFGQLANSYYFYRVRLTDDRDGVEWPDGQDLAPHELYELGVAVDSG